MIRKGIFIIAFLAIGLIVRAQQDPQFSQNMFNHMTINPAFAGEHGKWVVSGIYRNQWQRMEGAPETYAFNVDVPLKIRKVEGGIGVNMMSDKQGMQTNMQLMLNYSYKRSLSWGRLSVGVKVGILNAKIEGKYYIPEGDAWTPPSDDPALGGLEANASEMLFDMGVGAFLTGKRFYTGVALSHLTKPTVRLGQTGEVFMARYMYLTGGYTLTLASRWDLQPSAFIKTDFVSSQYSVNVHAIYNKKYWGGVSYRYEEAVVFMAGMELKNGIMVGYSYDWNAASKVGKYIGGSHEVTLSYSFGLKLAKRQKIYKSVRFL